jgi:hypothetical protein
MSARTQLYYEVAEAAQARLCAKSVSRARCFEETCNLLKIYRGCY